MIVCHCRVVNDRQVRAAVEAGARTTAQICRATGAGQTCGRCLFSLRHLLCHHGPPQTPAVQEVTGATC